MKSGFDNLMNSDAIENGVWMHVLDFESDEPMFMAGADGKPDESLPMRLLIRSTASKPYQDFLEAQQRKSLSKIVGGAAKRSRDKIAADAAKDDLHEKFAVLVVSFQNDGTPGIRSPSQDELREWAKGRNVRWVVKQAFDFADDPSQYGSAAEVGKPAAATEAQTS